MSAFDKWAKGQAGDDLDEDDLDEDLDDEEDEEEEELEGPDPEAIASRLWSGELAEDEIATMDKDLLGQVIDAAAEVEPEAHAAVLALATAISDESLADFRTAFASLTEADLHGAGPTLDAEQLVLLLDESMKRIAKGAKFESPEEKIALAKLIAAFRSGAEVEESEDDDLDDLDGDDLDGADDDALLGDFDA